MERRKSRTGAAQRATLCFLVIALALVAWSRCPGARERLERDRPTAEPGNEAHRIAQGVRLPSEVNAHETVPAPSTVEAIGSQRAAVEQVGEPMRDSTTGPWIEGAVGQTEYELALPQPASATGRVLLPPGLDTRALAVSVPHSSSEIELNEDGSWQLHGLEPGPTEIEVNQADVLAQVHLVRAEVVLTAGTSTRVPDLDLRGLRVLRVRVVDEENRPLEGWAEVDAGNRSVCHAQIRNGNALILTSHPRVEVVFDASGRQRAWVGDLKDGALVVLQPGQLMRVRLRDPSAVPALPYQLVARLGPTFEHVAFESSGEVELSAALPGDQRLQIEVRDTRWGKVRTQRQPRAHVQPLSLPIHVPESGEPGDLEIDVSAEYVADAIRRLEAG